MTDRQLEIHKGLSSIGTEIAAFYHDGVTLSEMDLDTKPYLLGHLSREIESGLRDVLTPKSLEDMELCEACSRPLNRKIGHKESIIHSLGLDDETEFVKQWYKVAKQFPKYAHRHGVWKDPREKEAFDNLWRQFEDILAFLVGNYYAIADRLDGILRMTEPSREVLNALPNLLKEDSRFLYFFNGLKHRQWLLFLEKEEYFVGSKNPEPLEAEDNPGFYSMPYWAVLTYLEEVARQNLEKPDKDTTESLVRIIDNISQFRAEDGQRVENYKTDYAVFKLICTLPEEYLDDRHFEYIKIGLTGKWDGLIGHSFNDLLERLISIGNKDLLLKSIEVLLTHRVTSDTFEKVHSIFSSYEFQRILSDYKEKLIPILGIDILNISLQKIIEVIEIDKSSFNNISIPAIENHEQTSFTDKYDCQLVYLLRDTLEKLDSKEVANTLKELLLKEHPIFSRISIHTIRIRYNEFKELFWDLDNPLDLTLTKHEVYELLKEHCSSFSAKEIDQIIDWINSKEYYIPEEFKDDQDKIDRSIAYRKKEWLTSLIPNGSKKVTDLIKELDKINDADVEHPGFDSWHSSLTGTISPLTMNEIDEMNMEEIISYYHDFNQQHHDFVGPSVDGLIDMLTMTVRKNPEKYIVDCTPIVEAPSQIQYSWIRGLGESWRDEKKKFECAKVFNVVLEIIQKEEFWASHNSDDNYCRWFVSSLISFIENGLQNDNHAFNPEDLPIVKEILFNILKNDNYPVFDHSDLSMTVLNNSKGKIFMALFQYSLRLARLEGKESNRWDNDVQELITQKIESKDDNPLLFYVIGQFLPNIHYLDENWMIQNFNKLFPLDSKTNWSASISGYFFHHRRPNRIHFKLFIEGSHLQEALSNDLIVGEAKNSLIQQICTAYLYEFESIVIDNDIIQALINSKSENVLSSLIYFFWSPRFPFEKSVTSKIKPFWVALYHKAIKMEDKELDSYILSGCCKWLNSVEEIDDELYEVLLNSAVYINQRDRYSIIESLSKHIKNCSEKVGNILIEIFKKEVSYDISRGKLQEIVEGLYDKGLKDIADKICLLHGEKGFHFLRDIYDKYNS
ncbi:hypothetical protein [Algoriphagus sp. CAU 1675]|uniref:hypothetical protein n=1 Tax=Algoriphagus sp. CAU 1675 TaxID=3032597 RepID=UPI0023DA982C|nr:hypothetical protein [Algoriphagus sp. CAU 1675]MDF2157657.1 hypothetical protein [Algoriphagus sp. CAU 1675]